MNLLMKLGKKKTLRYLLIILAVILAGIASAMLSRVVIPSDVDKMISLYTRNKPGAEITVAYISPDGAKIRAFGHNGKEIDVPEREYEIGSVTKTFTGALVANAVSQGRLSLDTVLGDVLPLPSGAYNPTVREIVTHTSAYSNHEPAKYGKKSNPASGITDFDVLYDMANFEPDSEPPYIYSYSDFGSAVAGIMLGDVYGKDYYTLLNDFVHLELGLKNTHVTISRPAANELRWLPTDAYIASSGLTSTITDMVSYTRMVLNGGIDSLDNAIKPLKEVNADTSVAYFWGTDNATGTASHSGETAHYASQILLDKNNGCAVVVLSNYGNDEYGSVPQIARAVLEAHGQY